MTHHVLGRSAIFIIAALLAAGTLHAQFVTFTPTGGPQGALYSCLGEGPDGTLFVGMKFGIVYRSFDQGRHWEWCSNTANDYISDFAFQRNGIVFAIARPYGNPAENMVFRSEKNGDQGTWTQSALKGKVGWTHKILAGSDDVIVAVTDSGIYRSVKGVVWNRMVVAPPSDGPNFGAIAANGDMYATVPFDTSWRRLLYRSTDNGQTWGRYGDTIPPNSSFRYYDDLPGGKGMVVTDGGSIVMTISDPSSGSINHSDVYRLDPGTGSVWTLSSTGLPENALIWSLTITHDGTMYACLPGETYRSTDNGHTWVSMTIPDLATIAHGLIELSDGSLLLHDHAHLRISKDAGRSWTFLEEGIHLNNCSRIVMTRKGTLLAAASNQDEIVRSTDGGKNWQPVAINRYLVNDILEGENGTLMASGHDGIARSSDDGVTWEFVNHGLSTPLIYKLATGNGAWYATTWDQGVLRSTDNGAGWKQINVGLPANQMEDIIVAPNGTLFVCTSEVGIYSSSDRGATWHDANNGIRVPAVVSVVSTPDGVLFGRGLDDSLVSVLYRSTDNGTTWTDITNRIPAAWNILKLNTNQYGWLFVSAYAYPNYLLARSVDLGEHWQIVSNPIRWNNLTWPVYDIVHDSSGFMYVATGGAGVWRSEKPVLGIDERRAESAPVLQVEGSQIHYSLPQPATVELSLYDALGRRVITIVEAEEEAGQHNATFSTDQLAGGIYFLRLQANSSVSSIPVLVVHRH